MSIPGELRAILPYSLKRLSYRVQSPETYSKLTGLRERVPANANDFSLKPFVDKKAIFVHIPKCGGISINTALFGCRAGEHLSVDQYKIAFSRNEFYRFFKFTFVRNPWDRLVSAFFFLKEGGINDADKRYAASTVDQFDNFEAFVKERIATGAPAYPHFRPQYEFVCSRGRSALELDFIGRVETFDRDFEHVCQRLQCIVPPRKSNTSASRPRDYRNLYDNEMVDIVARAYDKDIRLFEYSFE